MLDREVERRVKFLSEKYECCICPIHKTESLVTVLVLYKNQRIEEFNIIASDKCKFMIELANHFRNLDNDN